MWHPFYCKVRDNCMGFIMPVCPVPSWKTMLQQDSYFWKRSFMLRSLDIVILKQVTGSMCLVLTDCSFINKSHWGELLDQDPGKSDGWGPCPAAWWDWDKDRRVRTQHDGKPGKEMVLHDELHVRQCHYGTHRSYETTDEIKYMVFCIWAIDEKI